MNKDKYPEIWQAMEAAKAKLAPYLAKRKKHMDAVNAVQEDIQVLRAQKEEHHEKACADLAEIGELKKQIGRLGRIMDGPQQQ